MFERFTDRARRVVVLAQEEARGFNHGYIGTEHLLLGLLGEDEGLGARSLALVGVRPDAVRSAIEERVGRGSEPPKGHIPFTPRAKKVLELSLREALKLGHDYIGTEHILLGLLTEGEGVAAQILLTTVTAGLEAIETEVIGQMMETGSLTENLRQRYHRMKAQVSGVTLSVLQQGDEVAKRLEAIEARLSAIERLLREQRDEEEAS